VALVFAQLNATTSLRGLVSAWNAHAHHHYHLETGQMARSTLADAKPHGSLGRLERIAARLAVPQQSLSPQTHPRCITLFAGDHGVVESSVSAWPSAVTTAMMATIAGGWLSSRRLVNQAA
jgi:NaMN:DMB phosphoribosyltransferase